MATQIPLDRIADNPFQPRQTFDQAALQSLADEMKAEGFWNGALQGRRSKNGTVELVFGHRRLRALRLLKVPAVAIELLDLTDAQMALRSLEENLQREGLTDLEKADAVKQAVEIAKAELRAAGKSEAHAVAEVANRLGLVVNWVNTLCQISTSMEVKNRAPVQAGYLTAKTAFAAKQWGGDAYVKTLAQQGKQAAKEGTVSKPTHMTVAAMKKAVRQAPAPVQEKLKQAIVAGEVATPAEAERKARKLASTHTRNHKTPPPDLRAVILMWTDQLKDWEKQMRDVIPYMEYVEEVPSIAKDFRDSLSKLIETAKKLL